MCVNWPYISTPQSSPRCEILSIKIKIYVLENICIQSECHSSDIYRGSSVLIREQLPRSEWRTLQYLKGGHDSAIFVLLNVWCGRGRRICATSTLSESSHYFFTECGQLLLNIHRIQLSLLTSCAVSARPAFRLDLRDQQYSHHFPYVQRFRERFRKIFWLEVANMLSICAPAE